MLTDLGERGKELRTDYGNVNDQTIGAIQRRLMVIEEQGGDRFFGEPALDINDLMRTTRDGRGYMNVLAADRLIASPQLYATFLLWLLSELFEDLPEVGDPEKPKLVFFFDEAHLLFSEAPPGLLQKIEQTVKLIRSKGVGVYFVTQNPLDIPESVLAQMGNRVQHALRAYTPREQKAVATAASTFRPNPKFDTRKRDHRARQGRGAGFGARPQGCPHHGRAHLDPPAVTRLGPIMPDERERAIKYSPVYGQYEKAEDRESAYEKLQKKAKERVGAQQQAVEAKAAAKEERKASPRAISAKAPPTASSRTSPAPSAARSATP